MHSCFIHVATRYLVCQCVRIRQLYIDKTLRHDMAHPAGLKKPLNINLFWKRASTDTQLEWPKWAEIVEMAVIAEYSIEVRNLLQDKTALIEPTEPI